MLKSLFCVCVALSAGSWARNLDDGDVQTQLTALFEMDQPDTEIAGALETQEVDDSTSGCSCCEHACFCGGVDDGLKVSVELMLDELNKHKYTLIVGKFRVGKTAPFEEIWRANVKRNFCKVVRNKGRKMHYCFQVEVEDNHSCSHLHGTIKMTSPKKMNLGQFKLPLMTSSDDVSEEIADDVSTDEYMDY